MGHKLHSIRRLIAMTPRTSNLPMQLIRQSIGTWLILSKNDDDAFLLLRNPGSENVRSVMRSSAACVRTVSKLRSTLLYLYIIF
jgi:hypothetical protein